MAATGWTATYNGVNGVFKEFDPNVIGINPLPDGIKEQFNALALATHDILQRKVCGYGASASGAGIQKFNIVLSGTGDTGHKGGNTLSISITQV
jgi:hypothetical protein